MKVLVWNPAHGSRSSTQRHYGLNRDSYLVVALRQYTFAQLIFRKTEIRGEQFSQHSRSMRKKPYEMGNGTTIRKASASLQLSAAMPRR
jgi:hypothetical protein